MEYKVRVYAQFQQLPETVNSFSVVGSGSTKKASISDGVRKVLNHPNLKGKRYTRFKLDVFIDGADMSDNKVVNNIVDTVVSDVTD